jgi:hypothetical protein
MFNKRKNDIGYRILISLRSRIYKAVNRGDKSKTTINLIGCSIDDLKIHLASLFQSGMSFDNYGEWHIDHKMPCSIFDLTSHEQQKVCFHYTNLQPLWAKDNLAKSNKLNF